MSSFIESKGQPMIATKLRRLSKSGFMYESNSKSPRLDKMLAHISLFDMTTKSIEEDLAREREASLAQRPSDDTKKKHKPSRPAMGTRASEYEHVSIPKQEETPLWVTELTSRPARGECIYVTEVEHVEDDEDEEDWGLSV